MGKRIDWEGLLSVYSAINRQRDLTPDEQNSLDRLIARKQNADRTARYRENNREKIAASERKFVDRNREHVRSIQRQSAAKHRVKRKYAAKAWREANAEHVRNYNRTRKELA